MRYILIFLISISAWGQGLVNPYVTHPSGSSDPLDQPSLVSRWSSASLAGADNSTISSISDSGGGGNTMSATGGNALVNVAALDGVKEVEHFGDSGFLTAGNPSNINFDPDNDSFSIVMVTGEIDYSGTSGYYFGKGTTSSDASAQQFSLRAVSSSNIRSSFGGAQSASFARGASTINVYIITCSSGSCTFYRNGSSVSTWSPGSFTTTNDLTIGARAEGADTFLTGSWREICLYNAVLDGTAISDITTAYEQ